MADLLGFTSILVVSLITLIIALRWPAISNIIIVALIIRVFLLLVGHYLISLPGGNFDAEYFERKAWEMGQEGFLDVLSNFSFHPLSFFSSMHAIPYSLFGRSILMGQSISLLFGIGTVFLGWKLANKLWNYRVANKVGWTIALFPSLVLYSVLFLREVYISFFLLIAIYGVVDWVKTNSYKSIVLSLIGFMMATLFHGSMFVGAIIFIIILTSSYFKILLKELVSLKINLRILTIFLLFVFILGLYISNKISVPYIGDFQKSINMQSLIARTNIYAQGGAAWPEWTKINSEIELVYKAPIRSIYFLFSPFPWDIKKYEHLIGLLDSFLYMYLVFLILCNLKVIWKDPALKIILIILLLYIFVYGFGVGNFGTALRHKTKFTFMFILLAAPLIKRLIFFKQTKKIK
jgi:hypothetical protein